MLKHVSRKVALLMLLVLPFGLTACDSGGEDDNPAVTGTWTGNAVIPGGGGTLAVNLQLSENNRAVTGVGSLSLDQNYPVNVTGTHNYPSITMNLSFTDNSGAVTYTGQVAESGRTMTGNVLVSNVTVPIVLNKQ